MDHDHSTPEAPGGQTEQVAVLDDMVALVTGGSRGIGRAIARELARAGATVVVHYGSNAEAARETVAMLGSGGHVALGADLTDPDAAWALVEQAHGELGRIDILVNNAAVYESHPVLDTDRDDWRASWRRTIDTNLVAPANLIHAVVPHMLEVGGGRIVNVSSRGAFRGEPSHAAYGASKAGLNSLGQSMARALAPHGIYVTTVAPGFVETDMAAPYLDGPEGDAVRAQSPMGRAASAEEVARVVAFLATPGSESTTGAIVDVNGASYLRT
jgi:NAD(P)-dependent dehydrogenase (short-subunit alcohol dehydrogenase family)